jgi:hypothetical protein
MTHRNPHEDAPRHPREPQGVDEREWQAQERAMRAERNAVPLGDDTQAAPYLGISRALREPPMAPLPMDFAADVARHVQAAQDANAERFERILMHALIAVLGVSAGVLCVIHGAQWLRAIGNAMPDGGGTWLAVVATCAGMHWTMERWRERDAVR